MSRTIFILWDTETADPERYYIGGGEEGIRWINQRIKTHRARWGVYSRKAMAAAREYAMSEEMTDRQNVRVVTLRE